MVPSLTPYDFPFPHNAPNEQCCLSPNYFGIVGIFRSTPQFDLLKLSVHTYLSTVSLADLNEIWRVDRD